MTPFELNGINFWVIEIDGPPWFLAANACVAWEGEDQFAAPSKSSPTPLSPIIPHLCTSNGSSLAVGRWPTIQADGLHPRVLTLSGLAPAGNFGFSDQSQCVFGPSCANSRDVCCANSIHNPSMTRR